MGSGISTKYENTYFYRLKEEDSAIAEEEKQYEENQHGIISYLGDGKSVMFRPYPKSEGSPAVDIFITSGDLMQKIHFI